MSEEQRLKPALYLVRQKSAEKGVSHFGIVDVGNQAGSPFVGLGEAVVYHLTPPELRVDAFDRREWLEMWYIHDQLGAIERLRAALKRSTEYHVTANNCEHFAFWIARGRRESPQVRGAMFWTGLTALAVWGASVDRNTPGTRRRRHRPSSSSRW